MHLARPFEVSMIFQKRLGVESPRQASRRLLEVSGPFGRRKVVSTTFVCNGVSPHRLPSEETTFIKGIGHLVTEYAQDGPSID